MMVVMMMMMMMMTTTTTNLTWRRWEYELALGWKIRDLIQTKKSLIYEDLVRRLQPTVQQANRQIDQQTDQQTDQPTDGQTHRVMEMRGRI